MSTATERRVVLPAVLVPEWQSRQRHDRQSDPRHLGERGVRPRRDRPISTQSRSLGASGQAVDTDKIVGHDNTLTVGASFDYGWTDYNANSQLGIIPGFFNNPLPVIGFPYWINQPDSYLAPVNAKANNTYVGLYALDTFNATDRLALTGGARFNFAGINLSGDNGAFTNGYSTFFHVNPTVGLTYKITQDISFYAGYAMTNRAPTPLELGCAIPTTPASSTISSSPTRR